MAEPATGAGDDGARDGGSSDDGRKASVLALIDTLPPEGGGERFAADLAADLDPGRFERSICVTRWPYPEGEERDGDAEAVAALEAAGVDVIGLGRRSSLNPLPWMPLVRTLRKRPVDVLHAHKFGSNLWGSLLGTLTRVPVIVSHEHTWSYEGDRKRVLLDRNVVGRLSDAFVAVSAHDRRQMIEVEGIPPEKAVLIPNGIRGPRPTSGADVRAELGIPAGAPVAGAVGHLRAQKAYDVLIRAAALARERLPDLRVLIAGYGSQRAALEELIAELGLGETVLLLGLRDDAGDVIAALDVAASSSSYEGSPLALMEMMAAAKPVVATAVGGVPDLVVEGETGLLVPPGDPAKLADALVSVLGDRELAARMGAAGRERQRREFDFSLTVRRVEELYEELLSRASGRGR